MKTKKRRLWLKIFSLVMAFSLTVFSASCSSCADDSSGTSSSEDVVDGAQLTISQTTKNMLVGDTDILTADYTGKKGLAMVWASDNQSVVTVVDGNIEAVGEGTANVTVSCGNAVATCVVNVAYGNTLPELVNGYGFEENYTVYKNSTLHFTPAIRFRGKTYTDGTFEIKSSNSDIIEAVGNELRSKSQIGEAVITVTASWRKFNAANTVTLWKSFTVSVETSSYIALESGATNEIELYTLAEFEGETYQNSVDFVPVVYVDGKKVENATVSATVTDENLASIENGKLIGKQYGATTVLLTCQNGGETYYKTISLHVNRPIASLENKVKYFSALTGTYKDEADAYQNKTLASLFGDGVTLYDAYCGEKELTVTSDGRILGLESDNNGVVESEITVGNLTWQYTVPLEIYGLYIYEAEDLKAFTLKPAVVAEGEAAHATEISGYCVLARDIDASGLELEEHSGYKATWYPTPDYDKGFTGTLDGQGYTISNLTVKGEGLFSVVYGGTIKNIGFVNGKVEADGGYPAFFAHKMLLAELSNVYVHVISVQGNRADRINNSVLTASTMHKVKMTNVVVNYEQTAFESGEYYSSLGLLDGKKTENQGVWTGVYAISPVPLAVDAGHIMVASNQSETEITALKDKFLAGQTVTALTVEGVKSYASTAVMATATDDLTTFASEYWTVKAGVPYWNGVSESDRISSDDFAVKAITDGEYFGFKNQISFAFTDLLGNELPLQTTLSLVNDTDGECVTVDGNILTKAPSYEVVGSRKIPVKVTATLGDIQIEKIIEVTLCQNLSEHQTETINGLYIETDGSIVGLSSEQQAKLENASYRTDVYGEEIAFTEEKLATDFLAEATLGDSGSIVAISEDTVYILNYRFVTKAIDEASDLTVFTVKADGDTGHATEVSGYYVLTKNIDASELALEAHSGYKAKWYPTPDYDKGFTGTLDGQGHTISNLTVKGEGLFSVVYGGTIKNIGFVNGKVEAGGGYTAFFAHKMILAELSNVYVHVTSLNGNKTTHSVLTNSTMHKVKMTNVVVDYAQTAFDEGEYYASLGLIDGKTTANQGVWTGVYAIGSAPLALDTGYMMVACNQSETEVTALKDKFLSGQTVTTLTVEGVKSYANAEAMANANEDLSGLDTAYWDISTGVPVWKIH